MHTRRSTIGALAGIITGIVIQILGGNDAFPVIPPGIVFAAVGIVAAIVARPWWITLVTWLVPVMLLVGGMISDPGLLPLLMNPDNEIIRAGAIVLAVSAVAAVPLGLRLTAEARRQAAL